MTNVRWTQPDVRAILSASSQKGDDVTGIQRRGARIVVAAAAASVVTAVAASSAGAHQGHASCQRFGEAQSTLAQEERPFGQLASNAAQGGFLSALIAETHTTEGLCESRG
jgi:hypothetical protein